MNLVLSLLALAIGPLLYAACRKADGVKSSLDGFLFVTIAGIVIVYIVPDVFGVAGFVAIGFLIAGAAFAFAVEHHASPQSGGAYSWVVMLGALGLAVHAAMDGIALLPDEHLHLDVRDLGGHGRNELHDHDHGHEHGLAGLLSNHLALGVILHRIPVGMAIWWTLRPQIGNAMAVAALALIAASTTVAYLFGDAILQVMQTNSVACFQAFVAGTLLHVIVFSTVRREATPLTQNVLGERLGIIAGLFLIYLVPHAH